MKRRRMKGGLYLVVDPSKSEIELISALNSVLEEGVCAVQLWDHWDQVENPLALIEKVGKLCGTFDVPLFINNHPEWVEDCPSVSGIHFDEWPTDYACPEGVLVGITCTNEMEVIDRAEENSIDYISFCSMFPSSTSNSCEWVDHASVHRARERFSGLIFLAGGITPETLPQLQTLPYDGIAVVSGIMSSDSPSEAARIFNQKVKEHES
ncbi:MAG: thiamine phosphate synthase [Bacteroidetes bacterium]|nr:MAG: thiamine phosphate synthase [Bacteroidota bacterium]